MSNSESHIRYALTHINTDGVRELSLHNQSHNHFDTEVKGNEYLKAFLENNSQDTILSIFGKQSAGTFQIKPVECHFGGDAKERYFK